MSDSNMVATTGLRHSALKAAAQAVDAVRNFFGMSSKPQSTYSAVTSSDTVHEVSTDEGILPRDGAPPMSAGTYLTGPEF